jgi:hypothetical protein
LVFPYQIIYIPLNEIILVLSDVLKINYQINHFFLVVVLLSQVKAYERPSPVNAHVPCIFQSLPLSVCNPSFSTTSETLITPISCLLAKTSSTASLS